MNQEARRKIRRLSDDLGRVFTLYADQIQSDGNIEYPKLLTQIETRIGLFIREHGAIEIEPEIGERENPIEH